MLVEVGTTTDGKIVVAGLFRLYETEGIPLDVIFQTTQAKDMVPCWISFYLEAKNAGMSHNHILAKLESAIADSYGDAWSKVVIRTLECLHSLDKL